MKALVTGVAGFIGSRLAELLLADGCAVLGVDAFTPYYDEEVKRANLHLLAAQSQFTLVEADLRNAPLDGLFAEVDVIFHQAAQPGVRLSWSEGFDDYVSHNILATQRLLEAARDFRLERFVYASSSSVYGNADNYPTSETDLPQPHSPYGVTKLAAEHLCDLYAKNWGVPTVALRYFTVYGPRQRPDMAIHRLFESALRGSPFPLYGDGRQVRDFTFVDDVARANLAAARANCPSGSVFNVAGGSSVSMVDLMTAVEALVGRSIRVDYRAAEAGDVRATGGTVAKASEVLGWRPDVTLEQGLARQLEWHRSR